MQASQPETQDVHESEKQIVVDSRTGEKTRDEGNTKEREREREKEVWDG